MNYDSSDIACVLKYNVYLHLNLFLSDYVWFLDLSLTKVRLVLAIIRMKMVFSFKLHRLYNLVSYLTPPHHKKKRWPTQKESLPLHHTWLNCVCLSLLKWPD